MPLTDAGRNIMLDALGAQATLASLHSADPLDTGANELVGGGYARQPIDFNPAGSAGSGNLDNLTNPTFDVPSGPVSHFGLWTAGGVFLGGGALSATENFVAPGQYTLTDADVNLT